MMWQYERSGHSCFGGRNRCFGGEGFLEDIEMMRKDFREIGMSDVVCKTSTGFSFYDVVGSFTHMAFMSLKQSDVVLNTARMEPMGLPRNGHCCSKIRLLKSIQICCGCKVVKGCGVNFCEFLGDTRWKVVQVVQFCQLQWKSFRFCLIKSEPFR